MTTMSIMTQMKAQTNPLEEPKDSFQLYEEYQRVTKMNFEDLVKEVKETLDKKIYPRWMDNSYISPRFLDAVEDSLDEVELFNLRRVRRKTPSSRVSIAPLEFNDVIGILNMYDLNRKQEEKEQRNREAIESFEKREKERRDEFRENVSAKSLKKK